MSESVFLTAAIAVAKSRLRTYLRAPVKPASGWSQQQWAGITEAWRDDDERHQYREELPAAIKECDRWIDGDYATVFRDLAHDDELTFRFDEATGSLAVDFSSRVDFRLPTLVWACTVLRGIAEFMADGDRGIVTVTADWNEDKVLMHLTPNHAAFLDWNRDVRARTEARGWEIDIRSAACDTYQSDSAAETIDWLVD
ncbi:hypothetical protein GCM10010399_33280 [Dactylosporangium fulvum]|uniref:Uncharacterized protein n=1 Tax=Dactylosporangium fulvum TaxID=53359 RepID=A0ABY5VY17_9ACTN|nr:hypothetical protein [Dactylosporangium fulvum]UWP82525.1 hypothetical protein Dfulv_47070 [Dactylosporangium fulvum]